MPPGRVLVAGATGQLGGTIARQLMAAGVPVRALARRRDKLAALERAGAEIAAVDMLDGAKLNAACQGVDQIVSTANNNMGAGPTGPGRIDLTAHQNLCAAARNARVRRLTYVSFRGLGADEAVDIFRLKRYIEDAIRRSGVPYVMLRPTAFMDVWINDVIADRVRKKGGALIFGDGSAVANYIAVDDVATFAVRILGRDDIVNEVVEVGGPSDVSFNDCSPRRRAEVRSIRPPPTRSGADAQVPADHHPAIQRGRRAAHVARSLRRDAVQTLSELEAICRLVRRVAADARGVSGNVAGDRSGG